MRERWTAAMVFVLALGGCGSSPEASGTTGTNSGGVGGGGAGGSGTGGAGGASVCCDGPGTHDLTIEVDGYAQRFRLHIPPGLEPGAPMVVQLHGAGGSIDGMEEVTGLAAVADRESFVVVTPFGFSPNGEIGLWNAGACCGAQGVDHVQLLGAVIDEVLTLVPEVEPTRVYVAGQSNGAMMAYRMACQASAKLRGVIVNAGFLANQNLKASPPAELFTCAGYRPVSILAMHGLQDPLVAHEGSAMTPSLEDDMAAWRDRNGCPDESDATSGEVRRRVWACGGGSTIEFVTVADHGHPWPGSPPETATPGQGPLSEALDATEELWRFVEATSADD